MNRTQSAAELAGVHDGLISRSIFIDEDLYRQEMERIFARCWLFLGHESQIAEPGDYMTNYMGDDPVILVRDTQGKVRAFLNSCRHRGMKVCRSDVGNADFFRCPYHGWTYNNDGRLSGVPYHKDAWYSELDWGRWGLYEVPRVTSYGGLVFGCWDEAAVSLDDYLGDLKWYLDVMLKRPLGTLEVFPGRQRYRVAGNWKIAADNFAGDDYHVPYTHGSAFKLQARASSAVSIPLERQFNVTFKYGHGIGGITYESERYEWDLSLAERFFNNNPEVLEYLEETHRRLWERLLEAQAKVYALGHGNIFPNFSFNDFSALRQCGFYLWHPKAAGDMEVWQWCAIDSAAPQVVKEAALRDYSRGQSASGFFGQDDSENFEQVTQATRGTIGRRLEFVYQMGMGHEGEYERDGVPGVVGPQISEHCQRNFYATWAALMDGDGIR